MCTHTNYPSIGSWLAGWLVGLSWLESCRCIALFLCCYSVDCYFSNKLSKYTSYHQNVSLLLFDETHPNQKQLLRWSKFFWPAWLGPRAVGCSTCFRQAFVDPEFPPDSSSVKSSLTKWTAALPARGLGVIGGVQRLCVNDMVNYGW